MAFLFNIHSSIDTPGKLTGTEALLYQKGPRQSTGAVILLRKGLSIQEETNQHPPVVFSLTLINFKKLKDNLSFSTGSEPGQGIKPGIKRNLPGKQNENEQSNR
ncbi:MAG: hypothetical protein JSV88_21910 [Candidatus Aminicenantes bacterium]|nr:MAG: hypothetical protein JSV88_21910 [Candidatus Aminicenantes bacterium]